MPLDRPAVVEAPIGSKLLLRRMTGREELGRLFVYELDLLSEDHAIKPASLLGQSVTVSVETEQGVRYFNGIVSRFARIGSLRRHAVYHMTLRPWLWLLSRTTDCRIFQNESAPNVIKQLFREHGLTDIDDALTGSYRSWEYLVQYRETTLNFITRMMEQEGLYYYFKHEEKKHTLVLADSYSAHETTPGYAEVPYYPPEEQSRRERDHVDTWSTTEQIEPGTYVLNDFDFERPKAGLEAKSSLPRKHAHAEMEYYDYPGEYVDASEGEELVKIRRQALDAQYEQVEGNGDVRGLGAGALFKLTGHPEDDQNREYLILRTDYAIDSDHFESAAAVGGAKETARFRCGLTAIESHTQYRLQEITAKPTISGPQTAIIVGKAGEDIWTDKYGRVKVQFHWDRRGKSNEESSCWVRVAQYWAGSRFGSIHIPRLGQEVIVEFLEGDPDRPIVTGRVYNGNNMPPYDLPANQTQSGWKSRSSKGGNPDNFNEIRFEDKKGSEQVFVQAEKDLEINVKNNESRTVGADRSKSVGHDETVSVGNNRTETVSVDESITIGANRTESVGADESITIGANRTESVGANESITVGASQTITISANRTESVGANETISVGGSRTENVGAAETVNIGGARSLNVAVAETINVGAARMINVGAAETKSIGGMRALTIGAADTISVGGNRSQSVGGNETLNAGGNATLTVGKKLVITAADEITIKTGDASISMKKNGDIVISGKNITIKGSSKISIKADSDLTLKGSKIGQN